MQGQDAEEYCGYLADNYNSSLNYGDCDFLCKTCYGYSSDECFQCRDPGEGVAVEVEQLCRDTNATDAIQRLNFTMPIYVWNCSETGTTPTTMLTTTDYPTTDSG